MIKVDYHTHTWHSLDCSATIDSMINRAIGLGLEEIAITDHFDFTYPDCKIITRHSLADGMADLKSAQAKYAGKIKVLAGMELGLRPDVAEIASHVVLQYDLDIVIGSVHVDDIQLPGFRDYSFSSLYEKREAYTIFFENTLEVVKTCDNYDVLGHLDYVERYAAYPDSTLKYADYRDIVDEILKVVIAKGKGVEINTSGYGFGRPYPQVDIIRRYLDLGGEIITVGSDAHSPRRIAANFEDVYEILRGLGVRYISRFEGRKAIPVRL